MNFVSTAQLYQDMEAWERQLPEFDAVCGLPRSGLIPATYIALRRNIRLVEISDLIKQPEGAIARAWLRKSNPALKLQRPFGNRLLIVDDSSSNDSLTMRTLRLQLQNQKALQISYGAVYRASAASQVDYFYREVPMPRMFGWNWFRHWELGEALLDMDGVICEDWQQRPEQNVDPEFMEHLNFAKPLYPPQVPVRAVVTSRLERYRRETEAWLARHNVQYERLVMHPAATPDERRKAANYAELKGQFYASDAQARLFVESDVRQARRIAAIARKPVLCIDTMTVYQGNEI